jgi:hypothetical protein
MEGKGRKRKGKEVDGRDTITYYKLSLCPSCLVSFDSAQSIENQGKRENEGDEGR